VSSDVVAPPDDERHRAALEHITETLLTRGATKEEIDRAVDEGVIELFVADRMLIPSPRRYTKAEVAELTHASPELLDRLFRALGFPSLGSDSDEKSFTDLDIEAVRMFQGLQLQGMEPFVNADVDAALQIARVIGSSMTRIAEAEMAPEGAEMVDGDPILVAEAVAMTADSRIPAMARLLEYVWRRQMATAIQRSMTSRSHGLAPGQSPELAVGFADMVGFTWLSQHLSDVELAAVVRRFEQISHDTVTGQNGRLVKMIGDEAMFVVDRVDEAARIGLALADAYADDDLLSDVRVGLASGPVLLHDGDYFGPTVNLAHRIVNIANPGTVLMSEEFKTALMAQAPDEFVARPLRPRALKGLGRVNLFWCGRAGPEAESATDRLHDARWDRLGAVPNPPGGRRPVGSALVEPDRRDAERA
jgi:adenylate cyclase